MSIQCRHIFASVPFCLMLGSAQLANGQQPATAKTAPQVAASEAEQKAAILDSDCWRRAMFELDEWFRSQTIFTREEVAELRSDFAEQVEKMSANELRDVISDLEAKFKILDTPEVQEARAWFGRYLSLLTDRRREEVLRDIPNFPTMTASQLNQEIEKVQRRRNARANFNRNRQRQVDAQLQTNRAAQTVPRTTRRSTYRSPYRPVSRERPFDDAQIGPRRSMSVDPYGRIFMNLGF